MFKRKLIITTASFLFITILFYALLLNPGFQEKLGWHVNQWAGRLRSWVNPPQEVAFSSIMNETGEPKSLPNPQIESLSPSPQVAMQSEAPAATFAPIPQAYSIQGGTYFSQSGHMNYCGPANLAMLLSYWGWEGTHDDIAHSVRTYNKDKNIMPYELTEYAQEEAGMGAIVRVGGDLTTLKRLIAAGFPVMVEKGPHFRDINYNITWMGHYQVLNGFNDNEGHFIAQDSYIEPNYHQPYKTFLEEWRSFNYLYVVAFPKNKENDVLNLLGEDADENKNYRNALEKAQKELYELDGVDQFFAMFNYGSNLVKLRDYSGAADAYDQAFVLYDSLPEDMSIRPYRILWYQTGPFLAYYYTSRYTDVIEKATKNSIEMVRDDEPALEESYYWRGMARIAIGNKDGGIADFLTCLEYHRDFEPCVKALNDQGIFP
jgi:hypothetical protein